MEERTKCAMEQFTDCLKNNPNHAFDFIANNYYKFSKDELGSIAKELLYAIYSNVTEVEHNEILSGAAEELDEYYSDGYNEE